MHKEFFENFDSVQLILFLLKILKKRQYGSTNITFLQNFDQKRIWFNP